MDILIKNIELKGSLLLTPKAIFKPVEEYDHKKIVQKWEIVKEAEIIELPPHGRLIDVEPIEKEVKTWTSAGLDKYDFLYELDHAEVVVESST